MQPGYGTVVDMNKTSCHQLSLNCIMNYKKQADGNQTGCAEIKVLIKLQLAFT